jgi:hypothetical protein
MTYRSPLIATFERLGMPLDRETYVGLNYPEGTPDPWTAEHDEIELPPEFQWAAIANA